MKKEDFSYIRDLIDKGNEKASAEDKTVFELWNNEEIDTTEVIQRFLTNNGRRGSRVKVNHKKFERWLESLGYVRRKYKEKNRWE